MIIGLFVATLLLAYANGANDTFKGVATLFGSRTTDYRHALWWATATTLAGSCAAVFLSGGLVAAFSGKGLVPPSLTHDPSFLLAVGLGAGLTVLLATVTGFPVSTTHALTGALVGAGVMAIGSVDVTRLGHRFVLPLAVSPVISLALTSGVYPLLRSLRARLGIERHMCLCVDGRLPQPVQIQPDGAMILSRTGMTVTVGQMQHCIERYHGRILGIDSQWMLDRLHFLSAGAVSFARGLNDAPKIVALLLAAQAFRLSTSTAMLTVGLAMAAGGLLSARRVATVMSERITTMNHGQGFTANLITACLVLLASPWGLPVSTTHVACGSLFGLGAITGGARWGMIRAIVLSWIVTLPVAAVCSACIFGMLS